jgi:hypothetical protein
VTSLRTRHPRRLAVVAGLSLAALTLAGCSGVNPNQTREEYSASDGVRVTIGDVRGSNLMILSAEEDAAGVLHGALVNDGDRDVTVTLTFGEDGADSATVPLAAHSMVVLNGTDSESSALVDVAAVTSPPGGIEPITVTSDVAGSVKVGVPVLDGTLPQYAEDVPTEG